MKDWSNRVEEAEGKVLWKYYGPRHFDPIYLFDKIQVGILCLHF